MTLPTTSDRSGVAALLPAMQAPSPTLLALDSFSVVFPGANGPVPVVRGIDLSLAPGEALGIVGESGCGKSVTWLAALRLLGRGERIAMQKRVSGEVVAIIDSFLDRVWNEQERIAELIKGGKNPLSGIRGAAQLLEASVGDEDRLLTQLICDEADRIVKLVERVELFGDERPSERGPVNVHDVLDHVKRLAQSGFARHIRFSEVYDPSLPPVAGNRDQLVQVLLNLVKNAAEAIGQDAIDGEITLTTAYRPGIRMQAPGSGARLALPLEIGVRDNGPGVPPDLHQLLFDPFVTTKAQGSGLGLALVAKVIGDHGGIVECESAPRRTTFRIRLPLHEAKPSQAG